jgi:hypothetical protein
VSDDPAHVNDFQAFKEMQNPVEQAATIRDVSNATDLFNCIQLPPFNDPKWAFRGQGDAECLLRASIERVASHLGIAEDYVEQEFKRRAHHYLSDLPHDEDDLEWLALMQHHGAPTRLLDWTKSAYVAAFFAAQSAGSEKPFVIWAIDQESVNAEALAMLGLNISAANQDLSSRENFNRIYRDPQPENLYLAVPVQPFRMNERLTIQQGLFFCGNHPLMGFRRCLKSLLDHAKERHGRKWVHKLVVKPEARLDVLEMLDKMNINRATLFPGLDGFAQSLRIKTELLEARIAGVRNPSPSLRPAKSI